MNDLSSNQKGWKLLKLRTSMRTVALEVRAGESLL